MKRDKNIILQPYGKDDVSMNFIVSPMGKWIFGPSDIDKIPVIKNTASVFNYVRFAATNPKYYVKPIDKGFRIRDTNTRKRWRLTHVTDKCESIFFFLFYEPSENFVAMNYTTKEKEFDVVEKNMNVFASVIFYGKNFLIKEEDWDHGVTIKRDNLTPILEAMKNEQ